jgi:hypothetical protein
LLEVTVAGASVVTDSTGSGERDAEIVREALNELFYLAGRREKRKFGLAALDRLLAENARLREERILIDALVRSDECSRVVLKEYIRDVLDAALSPARADTEEGSE